MAVWEIEHIVNHVRREHSYVQAIVLAIVPLASLANLPTSMLHAHALALFEGKSDAAETALKETVPPDIGYALYWA